MRKKLLKCLLLSILTWMATGCGTFLHQPMQVRSARLGEETTITPLLRNLPQPRDPIVAAVYKFRDQTGQYKPSDLGANWSTAVTQGATNILVKAMEESGWFVPIERENVSNLLNERKIIRSSRAQFQQEGEEVAVLPPLLFAGLILEGGIVSYDANIITGGAGLRYFGAGGSGQYRQDRVTVYLRAISTSNGKVLKTVYTSKTLLSQAIDVGVFRFVSFQRLLEAETGITYNEPSELAVTEAIEKAVYSLIMEGIIDDLWSVKSGQEALAIRMVETYADEKARMRQTDLFDREHTEFRTAAAIQVSGMATLYEGDYPDSEVAPGGDLSVEVFLTPRFSLLVSGGYTELATEKYYREEVGYSDLNLAARLAPYHRLSPFVFGGGGVIFDQGDAESGVTLRSYYWKVNAGVGLEYRLTNFLGVAASVDQNYLLNDRIDAVSQGNYNDFFWRARVGLRLYINN